MKALLMLLMVFAGGVLPLQAGFNTELRRHAGHPFWAGLANFVVGLLAVGLVLALMRVTPPSAVRLSQAPAWAWLGGLCGLIMVVSSVVSAPHLGATLLVAALVSGQLIMSVVLDHFGAVGYAVRPVTLSRLAGVALLLCGLLLIRRG